MWGGWYDDPTIMDELARLKGLYDKLPSSKEASLSSEVVFFADEDGYSKLLCKSPLLKGISSTRSAMGNTGVPYDVFMVSDAELILKYYKAAVFPMPVSSEKGKRAKEFCEEFDIPYISASEEKPYISVDELISFYRKSNLHFYTEIQDVIYVGNGYVGLHSSKAGIKEIKLPQKFNIKPIFGTSCSPITSNSISFELSENDTALFSIST